MSETQGREAENAAKQERVEFLAEEPGKPPLEVLAYEPVPERARKDPPLLFVHGAWSNAEIWDVNFMPFLARKGWRCTSFSLRGHGRSGSGKWVRLLRVGDYLEDIDRMVRGCEQPPVLVGLSMGGYLVQKYLEDHRAAGGVLMAPVPITGTGYTTGLLFKDRPLEFLLSMLTFDTRKLMRTHELVRRSCFSEDLSPEITQKFFQATDDESVLINLDMSKAALPNPEKVQDPIMVMGSENDFFFPRQQVRETARAYGTEAHIFPDTAHVIPLEKVWPEAAEMIESWVEGL